MRSLIRLSISWGGRLRLSSARIRRTVSRIKFCRDSRKILSSWPRPCGRSCPPCLLSNGGRLSEKEIFFFLEKRRTQKRRKIPYIGIFPFFCKKARTKSHNTKTKIRMMIIYIKYIYFAPFSRSGIPKKKKNDLGLVWSTQSFYFDTLGLWDSNPILPRPPFPSRPLVYRELAFRLIRSEWSTFVYRACSTRMC